MVEKANFPSFEELLQSDPEMAALAQAFPDAPQALLWAFGAVRVWGFPYPEAIQTEMDRIHAETKKACPHLTTLDCLILNRLALDEEDF